MSALLWFVVATGPVAVGQITNPTPLSSSAALAAFQLDSGLQIELVAAEPLVRSPAAIAWDENARLFVAENAGYPVGPAPGEPPVGKIIELRDRNGDGAADERVEFAAGLNFPNGLMPWRGGWLVTDAPNLYWLSDTNRDGTADVREVWFTGFATNQSTQLRVCYPVLGPDGWIYLSRGWSGGIVTSPKWTNLPPVDLKGGDFRFRPDGSAAEAIGGNGQFGMVVDDVGRRFITSNRNPIMHAVAWPHWWNRTPNFYFNEIVQDVSPVGAEAKVHPISADLTASGFMPEFMHAPHAGTFTSACGLHQYFGERLPHDYQGCWFVCEPAQNLVQRQIMEPDGPSFRSRATQNDREFLASSDTWFHPVYAATGPDGALYLADMYRKFIDHPEYLPKEAHARIDFNSGKEMGRIWRISAKGAAASTQGNLLTNASAEALGRAIISSNVWTRSTATRLILEQPKADVLPHLVAATQSEGEEALTEKGIHERIAARRASDPNAGDHLGRARAVQLLATLVRNNPALRRNESGRKATLAVIGATFDPSPAVREAAFRVFAVTSDRANPLPDVSGEMLKLWIDDPSAAVRLQIAYALGQGDYGRMTEGLVQILRRDASSRWMRATVLSGLKERGNEFAESWFRRGGFDDSDAMLAVAYEMGRVYGGNSLGPVWQQAMSDEANGSAWQAALLAGLSESARQTQASASRSNTLFAVARSIRSDDSDVQINEALDVIAARNITTGLNPNAPLAHRVVATRLLSEFPPEANAEALTKLLRGTEPKELRITAARSLGRSINARTLERLTETWDELTPDTREIVLDASLSKPALATVMLDALEKGNIPAWTINANRRRSLLRNSDTMIRQRAETLVGKPVADRQKVFDEHKPVLTAQGNARSGREVFLKVCASCHRHNTEGFKVGPDLTGIKNQSREAILYHILVPDAEIYPGFQSYDVERTDGETLSGILAHESDSSVTLIRALGETDQIPRSQIRRLRASGSSLMPTELEKTMTREELADLLAFLTN